MEEDQNPGGKALRYDVVVLGGALAGGSTALLLRRRHPELRVLLIEKDPAFDWKVGEATVEVSAFFLTRVLRLYDHLSREQLTKQGLRYWFHNGRVKNLREASEVGPVQLARLPSFMLDRSKLDEHVLRQAVQEGAELWRPAKVLNVVLPEESGGAESLIQVERGGETVEVRAGWLVDASGRSAILARRRGWLHPLEEHPVSAVWARYRGVKDMDSPEIAGGIDDPFQKLHVASRRLATNHFNGYGYWIWFIPLQGGETSIGVVWDTRLLQLEGSSHEDRLRRILEQNPLTRDLVADAKPVDGDVRYYKHLPYLVDRAAGKGWSLVGDAAGFIDPFYSPGLDQMTFSVSWTLELIKRSRMDPAPADFAEELRVHNESYGRYLRGLFEAIYRDKYYLMGDYDLMTTAFLVDTCLYYFFVAWPLYRGKSGKRILFPPFYDPPGKVAYRIMSLFRGRLVSLAQRRFRQGTYGKRNAGRRPAFPGFELGWNTIRMFKSGLLRWIGAELGNLCSYLVRPRALKEGMPGPLRMPDAGGAPEAVPAPGSAPNE